MQSGVQDQRNEPDAESGPQCFYQAQGICPRKTRKGSPVIVSCALDCGRWVHKKCIEYKNTWTCPTCKKDAQDDSPPLVKRKSDGGASSDSESPEKKIPQKGSGRLRDQVRTDQKKSTTSKPNAKHSTATRRQPARSNKKRIVKKQRMLQYDDDIASEAESVVEDMEENEEEPAILGGVLKRKRGTQHDRETPRTGANIHGFANGGIRKV